MPQPIETEYQKELLLLKLELILNEAIGTKAEKEEILEILTGIYERDTKGSVLQRIQDPHTLHKLIFGNS